MTGEELYERWGQAMFDHGVGVDEWHELDAAEKPAWNAVAEQVEPRR